MNPNLLELFGKTYEELSGNVHFVADLAEAAEVVGRLVSEAEARRVAFGGLPEEARTALLDVLPEGHTIDAEALRTDVAAEIDKADVGVGWAEFAIARTGTLVEQTVNDATRLVSALPRVHIALLPAAEIVFDLEDAAPRLRGILNQYSGGCTVSFISGPSRTGDIEMKLILGVHGPETSHVIVIGGPAE